MNCLCEMCGTMWHLEDGQRRGGNIQWTDASFTTSFQSLGRTMNSIEQVLTCMISTSNMQLLWMHHGTSLPPVESWDTEHCLLNPSAQKAWNGRVQLYFSFARSNCMTLRILPRLIPRGQIWVTAVWALKSLVGCPAWHLGSEVFGKSSE